MSRRFIPIALAMLSLAATLTETRADAREDATIVVDKMLNQTVVEAMFTAIEPLTRQALQSGLSQGEGAGLTPAARDVVLATFMGEMRKTFLSRMRGEYIQIYMSEFTPAELQGLRSFLESPVGSSYAIKQATLLNRGSGAGGRIGRTVGIDTAKLLASKLATQGDQIIADPKDLAILRKMFPATP